MASNLSQQGMFDEQHEVLKDRKHSVIEIRYRAQFSKSGRESLLLVYSAICYEQSMVSLKGATWLHSSPQNEYLLTSFANPKFAAASLLILHQNAIKGSPLIFSMIVALRLLGAP